MAIRNVLLKKKIGSTLYDIYVKTDAALVDYIRGSGQSAVETNVAAELAKIASDASTAVNDLRTEIMGTGSINEYFDTVKEIADWLQDTHNTTAATIVTDLNNVIDDVGVASSPAEGTEGQEGYKAAVTATGLHADVEQNASDIDDLEAALGESTDAAGNSTAFARIKALETNLGSSSDAAGNSTAFARIKALEDVGSTKVEDGYAAQGTEGEAGYVAADPDGVIRVNGAAMVVYGGDPTIIQQDSTHRFVTDMQIANWDNVVMYTTASSMTTYASNLQANALYLVDVDNTTLTSGEDDLVNAFAE